MKHSLAHHWDVAVIGGGPAGMMAACIAAAGGASVILIEKNDSLGKKLLITGGGRCNVTNAETNTRALLAQFSDSDKFLFSAFAQWSVQETLDFFHTRNVPTKVEAEKRVFPASNSAQSIWDALVSELKRTGVTVVSNAAVTACTTLGDLLQSVTLANGRTVTARAYIFATGGMSRPETGSTGDGFGWLKKLGHTVNDTTAALVPITIREPWISTLAGVTLPSVKLRVYQNNVLQDARVGKLLFTHVGVTGPTVLNMSRDIGDLLSYGDVLLEVDLVPTLDYSQLNTRLQELFVTHHTKKIKNALPDLIPTTLVGRILENAGLDPDTACNSVTREARIALGKALKHLRMQVKGLLGTNKAVVTSGGVSLSEIDFKTMRSRKIDNLYVVGDLLDIDRPSGGYSLQLCWTTGFVAGTHAAAYAATPTS